MDLEAVKAAVVRLNELEPALRKEAERLSGTKPWESHHAAMKLGSKPYASLLLIANAMPEGGVVTMDRLEVVLTPYKPDVRGGWVYDLRLKASRLVRNPKHGQSADVEDQQTLWAGDINSDALNPRDLLSASNKFWKKVANMKPSMEHTAALNRTRKLAGIDLTRPALGEAETTRAEWERALKADEANLQRLNKDIAALKAGKSVENLTMKGALQTKAGLEAVIANKKELLSKLGVGEARRLAGIPLSENHVSDTIVAQMGGFGRLKAMLGAKVFELPNGIGIKWPNKERSRGNYVEIRLEPSDTYTMEFFNLSGSNKKSVKKYEDIYFDSLVEVFERQTGWFLSLGGSKKPSGSGRTGTPELPTGGTKHESKLKELRALLGED